MTDRNPQAKQMADESMVRTLSAQAEAIWPQERELVARYQLTGPVRVLDVGCGTGEITSRLAQALPESRVTGVDIIEEHLASASARFGDLDGRLSFETADAFNLPFEDDTFDLGLCRHMLQSVPDPHLVVEELIRVVKPGGRLHLLAEDYAMMHFSPTEWDTDRFWQDGPVRYAQATGSDLRSGRTMPTVLAQVGLTNITADYVVVDTLRVPRQTFAAIWHAWRDGYSDVIVEHSRFSAEEVAEYWRQMIAAIEEPPGYGLWLVPVFSGVVPA